MAIGTKRNSLTYPQRRKGVNDIRGNLKFLVAFLLGILLGRSLDDYKSFSSFDPITKQASSSIKHLQDVPLRNTSHVNPITGVAITKKQLLDPFVVPRQTGFSLATIKVGDSVQVHSHRNMHEFFYVLEGSGVFYICNSGNTAVGPGTFVHVAPPCEHGITVNNTDLKVLIAGVTVGR